MTCYFPKYGSVHCRVRHGYKHYKINRFLMDSVSQIEASGPYVQIALFAEMLNLHGCNRTQRKCRVDGATTWEQAWS